jgi:WD40 repeat protein
MLTASCGGAHDGGRAVRSRSIIRVVVVTSCLVCLPTRVVPAAAPSPQAVRRDAPAVPDYLFSFALAADGKTFAAGSVTEYSNDGAVYVGDLETPSLHWSVQSHRVLALAFSPDGALLATGHLGVSRNYGEVRLWNSHKGRVLFNLLGHRGIVHSVSFSPDGRFLASSGREITRSGRWRGQLFVWDTQSGQARIRVDEKRGPVGPVVFSRDGAMLISAVASSPYRSTIVIRDAQTGRVVRNLKQRFGAILAMEVYPDGRHLAVGSAEDAVTVNPQRSAGEVLYWLGGYARTAWRRGRITVLDLGSGESVWTYRDFRGQVNAVDLSADGRRLAATGVGVEVRTSARGNLAKPRQRKWVILSAEDGREIVSRSGGFAVDAMAFAPDGDQLITTGVDNRILTWSADGALTRALAREAWLERQHNPAVVNVRRIVNLAFSVDGGYLLSGDDQGSTRIWDVAGTTEIASIDGQGRFRSLAVF